MGRLLGIDFGLKRIGLAVTDDSQTLASPLDVLHNNMELFGKLQEICKRYSISGVVVGFPYSETYTESSNAVKAFAKKLTKKLALPVEFQNEELTTVYMTSFLKSMGLNDKKIKEKIDAYAAQKILSSYLEDRQKTEIRNDEKSSPVQNS